MTSFFLFIVGIFCLSFSPLLRSQNLQSLQAELWLQNSQILEADNLRYPSRTQAVLTSLLPIPFGNRIFYDGVYGDGFGDIILILEGMALTVGAMTGRLMLTIHENDGVRRDVLGICGGILGSIFSFAIVVYITQAFIIEEDVHQVGQLAGAIVSIIGGIVGAIIAVRQSKNINIMDTRQTMYYALGIAYLLNILDAATFEIDRKNNNSTSLSISPTYDVAQNGIGLGVSLRF